MSRRPPDAASEQISSWFSGNLQRRCSTEGTPPVPSRAAPATRPTLNQERTSGPTAPPTATTGTVHNRYPLRGDHPSASGQGQQLVTCSHFGLDADRTSNRTAETPLRSASQRRHVQTVLPTAHETMRVQHLEVFGDVGLAEFERQRPTRRPSWCHREDWPGCADARARPAP